MNKISQLLLSTLLIILASCNSAKETRENDAIIEEDIIMHNEDENDGFTKGMIVTSKQTEGCDYVIAVGEKKSQSYLDPINLDENLKVNGKIFWFKFTRSRRAMRCPNAQPITIEEIKKQ